MNRKAFIKASSSMTLLSFIPSITEAKASYNHQKPIVSSPSKDNSYWYIGHLLSVIISSQDTNGAFSLIHGYEIQGLEPPPHTHTKEDESFYLMSGAIDYYVGEDLLEASAGDWVFLPRNIQHSFQVKSDKAEVLIHLSPGGFENYFIEMSEPAKELVIPPKPQGPPDIQKIIETATRYGIVFPKR